MTGKHLFEKMALINDDIIEKNDSYKRKLNIKLLKKCLIAACLTVAICAGVFTNTFSHYNNTLDVSNNSNISNTISSHTGSNITDNSNIDNSNTDGSYSNNSNDNSNNDVSDFKDPVLVVLDYSAAEVGSLFGLFDDAGTSSYTNIYVPDNRYLYVSKIPSNGIADIYLNNAKSVPYDMSELSKFYNSILTPFCKSINTKIPAFKEKSADNYLEINAKFENSNYFSWAKQSNQYNTFCIFCQDKITLDGEAITVNQKLSDDEVIKSLDSIKQKLFDIFDVNYTDAKVVRKYGSSSKYGVESLSVYFYNLDDHPLNSLENKIPFSDNINISFDNIMHSQDSPASTENLYKATVRFIKYRAAPKDNCKVIGQQKLISLDEANVLLEKGYVFGGHSCPICMSKQHPVDFSEYDYVGLEYVYNNYNLQSEKPSYMIPFYAFYKYTGKSENGNDTYAKTYVCAVPLDGYDEYFTAQKEKHK